MGCNQAVFSAKGAKCNNLGHRPRCAQLDLAALKARNVVGGHRDRSNSVTTHISRPQRFVDLIKIHPGALPQAITFRAVGAEETAARISPSTNFPLIRTF